MTAYLAYAFVVAMIALAAYAFISAVHLRQHIQNQEFAWPYRERLAILAAQIREEGKQAPCVVRTTIYYLADRAFDTDFMWRTLRTPPPMGGSTFVDSIRSEYGLRYGEMVAEALSAMAIVVLLSDRKFAYGMRPLVEHMLAQHAHGAVESARQYREERNREEENAQVKRVRQALAKEIAADSAVSDLVAA